MITIQELENRISKLESSQRKQLEYPADTQSKAAISKVVDEVLFEKVIDIVWDKFIHIYDFLTVQDAAALLGNWSMSTTGGSFGGNRNNVTLKTGATSGNNTTLNKSPEYVGVRWDRRQGFRTVFTISSVSDVTAYIVRGITGQNLFYGFKIVNNSLKGVFDSSGASGGTAETTVNLATILANTSYAIEARYLPGDKIIFLLKKIASETVFTEVGSLATDLPKSEIDSPDFAEFKITTNTTADKQLTASFFEYYQVQ